jgi:small multidrug resistance pump
MYRRGMIMNVGYLFLAAAIVSEVTGSSLIKYTEGFRKFIPSISCLVLFGIAIFMLSKAVNFIPLYIAYALWGALGIILVSLISIFIMKESVNIATILGIFFIVIGVVLVNIFGPSH